MTQASKGVGFVSFWLKGSTGLPLHQQPCSANSVYFGAKLQTRMHSEVTLNPGK